MRAQTEDLHSGQINKSVIHHPILFHFSLFSATYTHLTLFPKFINQSSLRPSLHSFTLSRVRPIDISILIQMYKH